MQLPQRVDGRLRKGRWSQESVHAWNGVQNGRVEPCWQVWSTAQGCSCREHLGSIIKWRGRERARWRGVLGGSIRL